MYENKLTCGICGGDVAQGEDGIGGACLGCGNTAVYIKADIKKLNRITFFRNTLQFEKASALAEALIAETSDDCECYWAALLCEYGIHYVRMGSRRIPVCRKNVAELPALRESENFKKAMYYAPAEYQQNYENMAAAIENSIAAAAEVLKAEAEYDVMVLARENATPDDDLDGERLFLRFTDNLGFKVFYAPEMTKDMNDVVKAAHAVKAAQNSRILVAPFATLADTADGYLNNISALFAAEAAKEDSDKVMMPVFNSAAISFQQLPEQFVWLDCAFDSADGEFMREISEAVEKILKPEQAAVVPDAIVTATAANKENLIKRAYMFLEDGEFETADTYFDKILDIDIEDSRAYIGKLLAECKLHNEDEIANLPQKIDDDKNYKKAIRFATPEQKTRYEALAAAISDRINAEIKRVSEERQRLNAERAEKEEAERQRRARQDKEERKMQYQRRRDPLRKTLLEVQAELSKTFLAPGRRKELTEQEEVLKKNLKELEMMFPDIWD